MGQIYLRNGKSFIPEDSEALDIQNKLPSGTYNVCISQKGYYLDRIDDFDLPAKLYGDVNKTALRIFNTFIDRPSCTGVLLSGQKGSGKTMLSKRIAQMALEHGLICLVVNQPLRGEAFNSFIQGIEQPTVVLFDEFEKVYDKESQMALLTLLDGVYASKKLFILTCNDRYRVDQYMHNRPGRLFYALDFASLSDDFISEYCADNLKDKSQTRSVGIVSKFFSEFSFDMLKAIVEEMNRYDESANDAMKMLNMKPAADNGSYIVKIVHKGEEISRARTYPEVLYQNPVMGSVTVSFSAPDEDDEPARTSKDTGSYNLDASMLVKLDAEKGAFIFQPDKDTAITFTRIVHKVAKFDYDAF